MASGLDANGRKITNLPAPTAGSTDVARQIDIEAIREFARSRTNHTGTQQANTIENFVATVQAVNLNTLAVPVGPVAMNAQRVTGLANPTAAQDAATKAYVDAEISGLTTGQTFKGNIKALVKTAVTVSAPGSTLDGVTATVGDVYFLGAQASATEAGPMVFNGPAVAMTRPANWNTAARAVVGSYWIVTAGTSADSFLLLTNDAFTLNTTQPTYKTIDVAAAAAPPFETDLGDGAATSFVVTHNLNTRNVHIQIRRNASPYDAVHEFTYYEFTTLNTVTISPDEIWSSAQFHVVIAKM